MGAGAGGGGVEEPPSASPVPLHPPSPLRHRGGEGEGRGGARDSVNARKIAEKVSQNSGTGERGGGTPPRPSSPEPLGLSALPGCPLPPTEVRTGSKEGCVLPAPKAKCSKVGRLI